MGELYHLNIWWGMSLQHDVRPEIGSWRFRPETGGGPIYELVHTFDFVRFLAGEVRQICSMAATAEPYRPFADVPGGLPVAVPDSAAHLLELQSGATAVIHTSFVSRGLDAAGKCEPRIEVSGARGRIVTVDGNRLLAVSGEQGPLHELAAFSTPQPYEQFLSAITSGVSRGVVETSFHAGYKAAQLVDAAHLSLAERRWVSV